jgi:hypothetical protein
VEQTQREYVFQALFTTIASGQDPHTKVVPAHDCPPSAVTRHQQQEPFHSATEFI